MFSLYELFSAFICTNNTGTLVNRYFFGVKILISVTFFVFLFFEALILLFQQYFFLTVIFFLTSFKIVNTFSLFSSNLFLGLYSSVIAFFLSSNTAKLLMNLLKSNSSSITSMSFSLRYILAIFSKPIFVYQYPGRCKSFSSNLYLKLLLVKSMYSSPICLLCSLCIISPSPVYLPYSLLLSIIFT